MKRDMKKLKWSTNLYVGPSVARYSRRIRKRLDEGKSDVGHYLLTLAANENDELDILETFFLSQETIRDRLPAIVGIAGTKKEALELARKITEDCVQETGGADLRRYLQKKGSLK